MYSSHSLYTPHQASQGVKSTAGYSPANTGSAAIKNIFFQFYFFRILRFRDSAVLSKKNRVTLMSFRTNTCWRFEGLGLLVGWVLLRVRVLAEATSWQPMHFFVPMIRILKFNCLYLFQMLKNLLISCNIV